MSDTNLTADRAKFRYAGYSVAPLKNPTRVVRVLPYHFGLSGPSIAAYGKSGKLEFIKCIPLANTNKVFYYFQAPFDLDPKQRLYFSLTLAQSTQIANAATLAVTVTPMVKGTTAGDDPSGALTQALSAQAAAGIAIDIPYDTDWGYLDPDGTRYDSYHVKVTATINAADAAKIKLFSLNIGYLVV